MKQNITLSIEKELLKKAKVLAAQKDTSISNLLSEELERLVSNADKYEHHKEKAIALLNQGFHFGGFIKSSRDELHER